MVRYLALIIRAALSMTIGAALLAAAAHSIISGGPGYGTPQAYNIIAISAALAGAALVVGICLKQNRRGLAWLFVFAMIAAELTNISKTTERVLFARDAAQAPLRNDNAMRADLMRRITAMKVDLDSLDTSPRLATALKTQARTATEMAKSVPLKYCRSECRKAFENAGRNAEIEIKAARQEIKMMREEKIVTLAQARKALKALPIPRSSTPLADTLNMAPATVDMAIASLTSIALNFFGCLFFAFAGHYREPNGETSARLNRRDTLQRLKDVTPSRNKAVALANHVHDVDSFASTAIKRRKSGRVTINEIYLAYTNSCNAQNLLPVDRNQFIDDLAEVVNSAGFIVDHNENIPTIQGIVLAPITHAKFVQ